MNRTQALYALSGFIVGILVFALYAHTRVSALAERHEVLRADTEAAFIQRAEQADRIEATQESRERVHDCSSRARFEDLLSKLPSLVRTERVELDLLFASCGDYHARLKEYYATELEQLMKQYALAHTLHNTVFRPATEHEVMETRMRAVVVGERARANYMQEQVMLQREMNDAYAGRTSVSIATISEHAQQLGVRLAESDRAVDTARAELVATANAH